MGKIIPNTFMCPNAHVDDVMQYLSGDEYKVLNFAVRHIYGWQDEAEHKVSQISLSTFQNGFTTKLGKRFYGTGLGRKTIVDCLAELTRYKLLEVVDKNVHIGKAKTYKVGLEPDWEGLATRANDKLTANRARTEKARANRKGGLSDKPVMSDKPEPVMSDKPEPGLSDKPNIFHKANKTIIARSDEQPLVVVKPSRQPDLMFDAIAAAWNTTAGGYIASMKSMMLGTAKSGQWSKCNFSPPATPEQIHGYAAWWKKTHPDTDFPTTAATIQRRFYEYRATLKAQPDLDAAAAKRRADIEAAQRISAMIATGNYDALETEVAS